MMTYQGGKTITREQYDRMKRHDYAGPGTPMHPDAEGYGAMYYEPGRGTTLVTGIEIEGEQP